jgi:hypothetical protein
LKKALEPYIKLAPFVVIGIVAVVVGILAIFYVQRGAHVELTGSVQKVRTLVLDENSSAALIDFRVLNPSDYPFIVRKADVMLVEKGGNTLDGMMIADVDTQRLFQYYPVLGQKYNESLVIRTKINPHQSLDRMLAVRFDVPEKQLQARQALRIRIEDVDGLVSEIVETQR